MLSAIKSFLNEESGQTTTEYILILSLVVLIAVKMKSQLGNSLQSILGNVLGKINEATNE